MDLNILNAKISEMVLLQKELNDSTSGPEWENGKTQNNKLINWNRCIYMETAELIDSYPWKHWKNIDDNADYENIKTELIDIWHFILSIAIQELPINKISKKISKLTQNFTFSGCPVSQNNSIDEEIEPYEKLMLEALNVDNKPEEHIEQLVTQFFTCCVQAGLSINELHKIYIAKNYLNALTRAWL